MKRIVGVNRPAFYRDLLGLEAAGESINHGPEQEHLNNVFGARLHICGLTAGSGIGVEFLDDLTPAAGRPYPPDSQANDLWRWDITMVVEDADAAAAYLQQAGVPFISSGLVNLPDSSLGFQKGCLVRDPDGHAITIHSPLPKSPFVFCPLPLFFLWFSNSDVTSAAT